MAKYTEMTVSIGPTMKIGDSYIKCNVSMTATPDAEGFSVEELLSDLKKLYLRALQSELGLVKIFDGQTPRDARMLVKRSLSAMGQSEKEI